VLLACRRLPAASSGGTACKKGASFPALPAVIGKPLPRKIGRPIAFTGDVNSKDLSEADRRRIKRCVSYTWRRSVHRETSHNVMLYIAQHWCARHAATQRVFPALAVMGCSNAVNTLVELGGIHRGPV